MTNDIQDTSPGTHSEAGERAKSEARKLRDDASREAQSLKDKAAEEAAGRAGDAKDAVADEFSSVGKAFRTASGELREGSPQEQIFSNVADSLADFSDALRGRSVSDLVQEVSDFGRRNPVAFLGGAALIGFAAVRAARASRSDHHAEPRPDNHGTTTPAHGGDRFVSATAPATDLPRDKDS